MLLLSLWYAPLAKLYYTLAVTCVTRGKAVAHIAYSEENRLVVQSLGSEVPFSIYIIRVLMMDMNVPTFGASNLLMINVILLFFLLS